MALSENISHLVHTVPVGALFTDDSETIESMLPHGVTNKVSLQPLESAERMTAKMDATFENSGVIS